ncbi:winged helix domain-containing protein [Litoreibacter halocynthiae]|uniref:winged helix domain-containing protein n=1 Tax=Litoreibacter halocynthiae TaxID=1242689 RepID=UPI002490463F|nr:helix-turn-helix domain-containing protein [Litoreibacter halocynthiae]
MKIQLTLLSEPTRTFEFQGRLGWTLVQLVEAGPLGVTTIERPAPRWSGYIHDLRKCGIPIETEMEPHKGSYPGQHARYVLTCDAEVKLLDRGEQA